MCVLWFLAGRIYRKPHASRVYCRPFSLACSAQAAAELDFIDSMAAQLERERLKTAALERERLEAAAAAVAVQLERERQRLEAAAAVAARLEHERLKAIELAAQLERELQLVRNEALVVELERKKVKARAAAVQAEREHVEALAAQLEHERVALAAQAERERESSDNGDDEDDNVGVDSVVEADNAMFYSQYCTFSSCIRPVTGTGGGYVGEYTTGRMLTPLCLTGLHGLTLLKNSTTEVMWYSVNGVATDSIRIYVRTDIKTIAIERYAKVSKKSTKCAWGIIWPDDLKDIMCLDDAYTVLAWCLIILSTDCCGLYRGTILREKVDALRAFPEFLAAREVVRIETFERRWGRPWQTPVYVFHIHKHLSGR